MKDFVLIVSCFDEATSIISAKRYETASLLIPMFQAIKESLENCIPNQPVSDKFKSALLRSYNYYMNKYNYFEMDSLAAITFLDPR